VDTDADPQEGAAPRVTHVSDDEMRAGMATARTYALAILRQGPAYHDDGARAIVWEHGRRNFGLRADGVLNIVCPVADDTEVCGVGIFDASVEETVRIMEADPGVQAGVFRYEVHPCRSFPGDALAR
jgi:hypothetical protein